MRIVIVGGGIAGLFSATLMRARYPDSVITILEKNGLVGGRVFTKKYPDGSSFESGAGRFGINHKILMTLLTRYGLDKDVIPISNDIHTRQGPLRGHTKDNEYSSPEEILNTLSSDPRLTPKMLRENTIETLVRDLYGDSASRTVVHGFEYDSEIQIARAHTSLRTILETFRGDFGVLKGGLSTLIKCMEKEIIGSGGGILLGAECVGLTKLDDESYDVQWKSTGVGVNDYFGVGGTENANKILLCTTRQGVIRILNDVIETDTIDKLYGDNIIQDEPLMRVYARFPTTWLDKKIVTRKGVRYIIPVSTEPPIVMISYTDGPIARIWSRVREEVGDHECAKEIMRQLRSLFPRKKIPDPIWVSFEQWDVGASYWKPSEIDITSPQEQNIRQNPIENVYVCGEFLSTYKQAWIEGALERCIRVAKSIKVR